MLIAVAHNLHSMHNVGAIFRTADAAGFSRVILSGHTGAPPDPRIAKVALGAEQSVPFDRCESIDRLLEMVSGCHVVVLEQHERSRSHTEFGQGIAGEKVALVVCDELHGAPAELLARADTVMELPMRGSKESLNVSVAFGIAAYAVANAVRPFEPYDLRSRQDRHPVRDGVLTRGRTRGEAPLRQPGEPS